MTTRVVPTPPVPVRVSSRPVSMRRQSSACSSFASDGCTELGWRVVGLTAPWMHPARGAERLNFKAIHGQRDQLGVADLQLAAFPAATVLRATPSAWPSPA